MQRPIIRTFIFGALLCFLNAQNDPFVLDSSLSAVINQSIANDIQVADVDNDGYNDIIYSGENQSGNPTNGRILNTFIPQNQGNDWWSQEQWRLINSAVGIYNVGDRTTFITTGRDQNNNLTTRNYGNNSGFPQVELEDGDIAVADFNNDGYKDFLFTGQDKSGTPVTKLYTGAPDNKTYNSAHPIVYNLSDYNFTGLYDSTADFVDYDMDGDLDIFITGSDTDGVKTILYEVNSENKIKNILVLF